MIDKELSSIEIRLLLVKYGYTKIIQTLAKIKDDSVEKIEEDIRKLESSRKNKIKPPIKTISEIVKKIANDNPTKADALRLLGVKYENKTFLPQVKDVKRFLDKHSPNPRAIKSRLLATSQVFTTLASLSNSQLQEYISNLESNNFSALSILSDQIIGKKIDKS